MSEREEELKALRETILKDLANEYVPVFVKWLRKAPWYYRGVRAAPWFKGLFWTCGVFGLGMLLYLSALALFDSRIANVWSLTFLPIWAVATLYLPAKGYEVVVEVAPFLLHLPSDREGLKIVKEHLKRMYCGWGQWMASFDLALIGVVILVWLRNDGMLPSLFQELSKPIFGWGLVAFFALGLPGGWGLWLICTMPLFAGGFSHLDASPSPESVWTRTSRIRLNPIAPGETVGISRLLRVAAVYSLYYSFGVVTFDFCVLMLPWQHPKGDGLGALVSFWGLVYLMPVVFTAILLLSVFYPAWKLSGIVTQARDEELLKSEEEIRTILGAAVGDANPDAKQRIERIRFQQKELLQSKGLIRPNAATSMVTLAVQVPVVASWMKQTGLATWIVNHARDLFVGK